jgi:hypothetical protein
MRLFEFFRRSQKAASFETLRRGQPDPAFVGDFLVDSFIYSHFGLSDADLKDLAATLPQTVRELAGFWITLYLCWILRMKVRAKYGDAFFEAAFEASRARLALGEPLVVGTAGFADTLTYWFQRLDDASASIGQTVEGIQIPMEFFAALCFLVLTPESPFFKQTEIPPGLDLDLAEVLQRAKAAALQLIELVGEVGGPLKPAVGDSGGDRSVLEWSSQPCFHERRLLLRNNNTFFPPERRSISEHELSAAKQMDAEMLKLFEESVGITIATLKNGGSIAIGKATGLLKEMEELVDHGSGLGSRAHVPLSMLQVGCDALRKIIEENVDEGNREGLMHAKDIIQRLSQLERHQAYIDVSRAEPTDRLPTLLTCSAEDLRLLFQELPSELADVSKAWQKSKEELRTFAIQLMRDSPEAKSKLLQDPEKLELLGIVVPARR